MTNISIEKKTLTTATLISGVAGFNSANRCKPSVCRNTNSRTLNMKRPKTLFLAWLLALLAPLAARAQFGGGSGTQIDPYIIRTTSHWLELANNVNNGNGYFREYFRLDADLDFSGISFQPVGTNGFYPNPRQPFVGSFDGNGHTISNVIYNGTSQASGLFGYAEYGIIENLTLGGASNITDSYYAGGIIGTSDRCTIRNCHVGSDVVIRATNSGAGGIVGMKWINGGGSIGNGSISDCTNEGTVIGGSNVGGIIGYMGHSGIPVTGCTNLGTVTGYSYVGGIIGKINGNVLTNCHVGGNCTIDPIGEYGSSQGTTFGILSPIIYAEGVSGNIISLPAVTVHGTAYYMPGSTVRLTLAYSGTVADGYVVPFSASNDSLVFCGLYHELALPASGEVVISALPPVRDIGYAPWVSINTPQQSYTEEPITPVITVIDNMGSTPVTLIEGTDYEVVPPEGDCVYPGDYIFGIKGIGLFSGYTTTVFTIYHEFFQGGNGSAESPFLIFTTDDMTTLATRVNAGDDMGGLHFRLEVDLDYTGKEYKPIGTELLFNQTVAFNGTFDGNGHTISHANINENSYSYDDLGNSGSNYLGLFGCLGPGSMVKNLRLADSQVISSGTTDFDAHHVGGIAGIVNGGTIDNCEVTNDVTIHGCAAVGGIAGMIVNGTINRCVVGSNVMIEGGNMLGGIVGRISSSTITNNLNLGEVWVVFTYISFYGSIVGNVEENNTISNNYHVSALLGGIGSSVGLPSDVAGQAMRGYAVRGGKDVSIALAGTTGVAYNGAVYAGRGQSVRLYLNYESWGCIYFLASSGTLYDNGDYYTLTMSTIENITIYANNTAELVEVYGTYYRLACDGSNTAMVVYDDSYATTEGISVEDFEHQGTPYTVIGIADNAFAGCLHLKWFDCHANLLSIGDFAFRNCDSLEYLGLYHTDTPPSVGTGAFDGLRIDTLMLMVPFCSQYEYSQHPVWGQFGTIFPQGVCEYSFVGLGDDQLWSNPENWAEGEVPGEGAQVGIMSDCEMDMDVTVGSITIGNYYDEEYGYYERLTVKSGNTLTASNFVYTTGDARNFVIEDGAQVIHPNTGTKATLQRNISAYNTENGMNNGWHLIGYSFAGNDSIAKMENLLENDYDFYYYNEPTHYWMNHENMANNFTELEAAKGYVYANSEDVTLSLRGTLNPANEIVNVPLSRTAAIPLLGLNLVGNPFACNAYLLDESNQSMPFFRMNDAGDAIVAVQAGTTIKPGEAVFVVCPNDGQTSSAIFTTTAPASIGETQNVPSVLLPLHKLLVDQDAFLNNSIVQTIELVSGWNWVSFNVETTLDGLKAALVAALPGTNSITIKSKNEGAATYNGTVWRGQLGSLDLSRMYRVYVEAACEITLEGLPINPAEHPITLSNGFNWIAFPFSESKTLTEAFAGFAINGDAVKSKGNGAANYNGTSWRGTLNALAPGQGYIYKSNAMEDRVFTFPTSAK